MADLFGNEFRVLAKALDYSTQRNTLIVSNLANADTPGYKEVSIQFEKTLQEMVQQQEQPQIRRTDPKHFPLDLTGGYSEPEVVVNEDSVRRDGNSVDTDQEIAKLSINQIRYNADAEVIHKLFKQIEYAIQEGGQ